MWERTVVGALLGAALTMLPTAAAPAATRSAAGEVVGLWDADFAAQAAPEDCGHWRLDANGFCVADDTRNGVELGLKFQASRRLVVTGVRVYRVDPGTVTGTLWNAEGKRLATGTFAPSAANGWQDLTFSRPVTIGADRTYVASYYSPATRYAFDYGFFTQELTRGPVTALRSVDGDPNGVHCYDVATCPSFPAGGFRDSSYWVTPLWENPPGEPFPPPPFPTTSPDAQPPSISAVTPSGGATEVGLRQAITIRFSEPVRAALLTRTNVRLRRKGQRSPVGVRLRYDERRQRLTLDPRGGLRASSTYRVVISTRVVDIAGNRLDQDPRTAGDQQATWSFRTR